MSGIRKGFGLLRVLEDVSLEVRAGEALALLGANGTGKTTLLRILATLTRPSRGTATVAGLDCVREAERVRRHVGYVGHGAHVYDDLTAAENLAFWAALAAGGARAEAIEGALAAVELDTAGSARVRTFSAGMRRRLSLARLLITRPRVLLLDEPFASLDQRAKKWLEDHLEGHKAGGGAVVMSTHSFGRELGVADRIAILAEGRVVMDRPRGTLATDELGRLYALHTEAAS